MDTRDSATSAFQHFIKAADFPCVAAKSALATDAMRIVEAADLRDRRSDARILSALRAAARRSRSRRDLSSTVILFPATPALPEPAFETHLWALLQSLYDADRQDFECDPTVSIDPRSPDFALSIGGAAFFVVGLHPGSSRLARRTPMAAVAFNPHAQFRRLKEEGRFERMRRVIRRRDIALQGAPNPMLADHGEESEALQYSGRSVSSAWKCPFRAEGANRWRM